MQSIPTRLLLAAAAASATFVAADAEAASVRFDTVLGEFDVELFEEATPISVANFLSYVTEGLYDNSIFHRADDDFVLQGGLARYSEPVADPFDLDVVPNLGTIENEPGISNTRGTIAYARSAAVDSASSQFFFNLADNTQLDTFNEGFTVFGQVLGDGMDIVDALAQVEVPGDGSLSGGFFPTPFGELPLRDFDADAFAAGEPLTDENFVIINSVTLLTEEAMEPDVPDVPVEPEPEVPETPVEPEAPEAPEVPEMPEPEAPEVPEVPEPEAPEVPEMPEPEAPVVPGVPDMAEGDDGGMDGGGVLTPPTGGGGTAVPSPSAALGGIALLGALAARRRR